MRLATALFVLLALHLSSCAELTSLGVMKDNEALVEGGAAFGKFEAAYRAADAQSAEKILEDAYNWKHSAMHGFSYRDRYEGFQQAFQQSGFSPSKINADGNCREKILDAMVEKKLLGMTADLRDELKKPCEPNPEDIMTAEESAGVDICRARQWIREINADMDRQKRIEAASGVADLTARRQIGSRLVKAREEEQEALNNYWKITGRSFKGSKYCPQ
jgi:hypothetical protein